MKDLIEALTIFLKYKDEEYPTHCGYDVLYIMGVEEDEVSEEDKKRLDELGFHFGEDCWESYKYGSA